MSALLILNFRFPLSNTLVFFFFACEFRYCKRSRFHSFGKCRRGNQSDGSKMMSRASPKAGALLVPAASAGHVWLVCSAFLVSTFKFAEVTTLTRVQTCASIDDEHYRTHIRVFWCGEQSLGSNDIRPARNTTFQ